MPPSCVACMRWCPAVSRSDVSDPHNRRRPVSPPTISSLVVPTCRGPSRRIVMKRGGAPPRNDHCPSVLLSESPIETRLHRRTGPFSSGNDTPVRVVQAPHHGGPVLVLTCRGEPAECRNPYPDARVAVCEPRTGIGRRRQPLPCDHLGAHLPYPPMRVSQTGADSRLPHRMPLVEQGPCNPDPEPVVEAAVRPGARVAPAGPCPSGQPAWIRIAVLQGISCTGEHRGTPACQGFRTEGLSSRSCTYRRCRVGRRRGHSRCRTMFSTLPSGARTKKRRTPHSSSCSGCTIS